MFPSSVGVSFWAGCSLKISDIHSLLLCIFPLDRLLVVALNISFPWALSDKLWCRCRFWSFKMNILVLDPSLAGSTSYPMMSYWRSWARQETPRLCNPSSGSVLTQLQGWSLLWGPNSLQGRMLENRRRSTAKISWAWFLLREKRSGWIGLNTFGHHVLCFISTCCSVV